MSRSPRGRTTRFRVPFVLIVCLTTATAVASPTLVPPDAAAGLPRVVEVETASPFAAANADGLADACDAAFPPLSLNFTPPAPRSPSPWGEGSGVRGVPADSSAESPPPIAVQSVAEFAITSNCTPHPRPLARGRGEEMEGDSDSGLKAATFASPSLIELDALFADVTDQPPVVRAQSPEIDLLPLASGDVPLENTSILRAITGTKGRVRADYLTDFGGTDRFGVQMLTQAWYGIGLDVEANYWQRPVPDLGIEPLWTGDANLIYNFMPHPRFKFRSGLGAAWIVDDGDAAVGYNVTHGLDVYLLWRAMATGELEWGEIDSDKLFRYRLALGLTFDVCEVFTGYESYELGNERLDGWVNGIAFWY